MVGGRNYDESPFNLATEGERQPGSSFKAFDLAAALEHGISPDSVWTSKEKVFIVPNSGGEKSSSCTTTKATTPARTRSPARPPSRTTRSTPKSA